MDPMRTHPSTRCTHPPHTLTRPPPLPTPTPPGVHVQRREDQPRRDAGLPRLAGRARCYPGARPVGAGACARVCVCVCSCSPPAPGPSPPPTLNPYLPQPPCRCSLPAPGPSPPPRQRHSCLGRWRRRRSSSPSFTSQPTRVGDGGWVGGWAMVGGGRWSIHPVLPLNLLGWVGDGVGGRVCGWVGRSVGGWADPWVGGRERVPRPGG